MDEAQTSLRVRLGETRPDQVFQRDDGGLRGPRDVEFEVWDRGAEADG